MKVLLEAQRLILNNTCLTSVRTHHNRKYFQNVAITKNFWELEISLTEIEDQVGTLQQIYMLQNVKVLDSLKIY